MKLRRVCFRLKLQEVTVCLRAAGHNQAERRRVMWQEREGQSLE